MSALGRERVFEHFSRSLGIPVTLFRLNYACELRYGVLVDIARRVWSDESVELGMGAFNVIWQGDACAMALAALGHASVPPLVLNVTGPETLSVRRVAEEFGDLMGKPVKCAGTESPDALLSNAQAANRLFGNPRVTAQQMIHWIADWVMRGGESLGKSTHFESRDGKY
jgi:nucleoside-diphosphate-sugar epimerase